MNDVAYRINTSNPVRHGTVVVGGNPFDGLASNSGCTQYYRAAEKNQVNESPVNTGLANRFDDTTYYSA